MCAVPSGVMQKCVRWENLVYDAADGREEFANGSKCSGCVYEHVDSPGWVQVEQWTGSRFKLQPDHWLPTYQR